MLFKNIIFDVGNVLLKWNPFEILKMLREEDASFPNGLEIIWESFHWKEFDRGIYRKKELMDQFHFPNKYLDLFLSRSFTYLSPIVQGVELLLRCKEKGFNTYILSNIV